MCTHSMCGAAEITIKKLDRGEIVAFEGKVERIYDEGDTFEAPVRLRRAVELGSMESREDFGTKDGRWRLPMGWKWAK